MVTSQDFAARLSLYKSELPRRGLVLFLLAYLPFLLAVIILGALLNVFTPPYAKIVWITAFFSLGTILFMIYFAYMALRGLPAKIGLLCPQCHRFSVLHGRPADFRDSGKCPCCGEQLFELQNK